MNGTGPTERGKTWLLAGSPTMFRVLSLLDARILLSGETSRSWTDLRAVDDHQALGAENVWRSAEEQVRQHMDHIGYVDRAIS